MWHFSKREHSSCVSLTLCLKGVNCWLGDMCEDEKALCVADMLSTRVWLHVTLFLLSENLGLVLVARFPPLLSHSIFILSHCFSRGRGERPIHDGFWVRPFGFLDTFQWNVSAKLINSVEKNSNWCLWRCNQNANIQRCTMISTPKSAEVWGMQHFARKSSQVLFHTGLLNAKWKDVSPNSTQGCFTHYTTTNTHMWHWTEEQEPVIPGCQTQCIQRAQS